MTIEAAFLGTLGRDAESKTSSRGKPYLRTSARVGDGEHAQWVNITAFDVKAIADADKFVKGTRVYFEGRLTLDRWTTQDGAERHGLSLISWHCRLAQIGRNKPQQKPRDQADGSNGISTASQEDQPAAESAGELNDVIPF